MPYGRSTALENVNIQGTNYSRYGVSIYRQLYSNSYRDSVDSRCRSVSTSTSASASSADSHHLSLSEVSSAKSSTTKKHDSSTPNPPANLKTKLIKRKYRSLISTSKKIKNKLHDYSSSDTFSIFSAKSYHRNGTAAQQSQSAHVDNPVPDIQENLHLCSEFVRTTFGPSFATINDLSVEILARILSYIENDDKRRRVVLCCLYVSKKFSKAAKIVLYENPYFTSTFRVAQFVTSLRLNPENGNYVKCLDLSHLKNGLIYETVTKNTLAEDSTQLENGGSTVRKLGIRSRSGSVASTAAGLGSPAPESVSENNSDEKSEVLVKDLAYASWRDWRFRNDALYSSAMLNSYNLKKTASHTGSLQSPGSSSSIGFGSDGTSNGVSFFSSRGRRSVSSASLTPNGLGITLPRLSPVSSHSSASYSGPKLRKMKSSNFRGEYSSGSSMVSPRQTNRGTLSPKSSGDLSRYDRGWHMFKFGSKSKYTRRTSTPSIRVLDTFGSSTSSSSISGSGSSGGSTSPTTPFSAKNGPLKIQHPYANKFLLKYASSCDLPLGYILHMLTLCPNLVEINLSKISISDDFKIVSRKPRMNSLALLPALEETESKTPVDEDHLDIVYATDSSKNFESFVQPHQPESRRHGSYSSSDTWVLPGSNSLSSTDYPLPIDGFTQVKQEKSLLAQNLELVRLSPSEIFEFVCNNNSIFQSLRNFKMDKVIWCRRYMIEFFIFNTLRKRLLNTESFRYDSAGSSEPPLNISFWKSGMNKRFAWAGRGTFYDFVMILVLDDILRLGDTGIETLFRIKTEKLFESGPHRRDPDILEVSNIFHIKFGLKEDQPEESLDFRLTVLQASRGETSYKILSVSPRNISLVVKLHRDENYNRVTSLNERLPKDPIKRINRLTHAVVAKVRELRSDELRRNLGENNYSGD